MTTRTKDPETRTVQKYLEELRKYPPISRQEEKQTLERARRGDREALDRLITSNLRFVVSVALEYQGRGLPLSELIAEGNVGLMEALNRFDETRGYKFISYAVWWIHQAIQKALKNTATVSMPVNRQEDMGKITRRWQALAQELGRTPSLDEVSIDMKLSRKRAERALHSVLPTHSLDAPLSNEEEEDRSLLHFLKTDLPAPDYTVLEQNRRDLIEESLSAVLDERERQIINAYFGLDEGESRTLGEIGDRMGITRERVRQLRNRALDKMRRFFARRTTDVSSSWQEQV